jgi:tRNA(fMet)-specific endonuclease VapC
MKYLLDTNACVYFLNNSHPKLTQKLLRVGRGKISVSILTIAELEYGAANSARPEENRSKIDCFTDELEIVAFDSAMARQFGAIKRALKQLGRRIGEFDIAIAASALAEGRIVVTHDVDFQNVEGLKTEDWTH